MCRLPPEIVNRIFQDIQESDIDWPYEWWWESDKVHEFFDNASIVCQGWRALARSFRTSYRIDGQFDDIPPIDWQGEYARNGAALSAASFEVKHLLIAWMEDDGQGQGLLIALPRSLPDMLLTAEYTLVSLSLQGDLLQSKISKNRPGVDDILQRILKRVERLHVYSDQSIYGPHGDPQEPGYELPWRDLAESVWMSGRSAPLKELALFNINIEGVYDLDVLSPCPARTVHFKNVCFECQTDYLDLFPDSECFIWEQTSLNIFLASEQPTANLTYKKPSQKLKHLGVAWDSDQCPLDLSKGITTSPNLRSLRLRQNEIVEPVSEGITPPTHPYLTNFAGKSMPCLQELRVDCAKYEGMPDPQETLLEMLKDPTFCPKLSRTPVQDLPDGCLALFLAKST